MWYGARAIDLIQDRATSAIIGVTADIDGQTVNVRARNGAVMSCGGFEANQQMMQDWAGVHQALPIAANFNTGDGHIMAMRVGAQMSAMSNIMCYINCLYDDGVTPEWNSGTRLGKANYTTSLIYVGADGTRFMNENFKSRHGYMPWHGNFVLQKVPVPAWCVFDQNARENTVLSHSLELDFDGAVEAGRVIVADTIEELAAELGLDPQALSATVERYNYFCEIGEDYEFHRNPEAMQPIAEEGPYYAFRLVQSCLNT